MVLAATCDFGALLAFAGSLPPSRAHARRLRVMSSAVNEDDASNPRAKVSELSEKVVDTNPYSRLMCAGRHRHACCAAD